MRDLKAGETSLSTSGGGSARTCGDMTLSSSNNSWQATGVQSNTLAVTAAAAACHHSAVIAFSSVDRRRQ